MEKINVAELLRNCPNGMELDCTIWNNVTFDHIDMTRACPIYIRIKGDGHEQLTEYGQWNHSPNAKCVIFPKGKTTWEGFVPPCQFKDGDILATDLGSVFYLNTRLNTDECYGCYVGIGGDGSFHICEPFAYKECCELATEKEKQKLFQAIKDNGYKWNAETKTLEKLPKFKVGDRIKLKTYSSIYTITDLLKDKYRATIHFYDLYEIEFERQDAYELVPNKFDINTLVPFESKVLVRHNRDNKWCGSFFSHIDEDFHSHCYKFVTTSGKSYPMCIPYEGNEHLLGTTDDCDEFYKTWK